MHACVLVLDVHLPASRSLKDKRAVIRHLLDRARIRFSVAAAEVDHLDQRQRAALAFAALGNEAAVVQDHLDSLERFIWSHPELEVLSAERHWLDTSS